MIKVERLVLGALAVNCWILYEELPREDRPPKAPGEKTAPRECTVIDPGDEPDLILNRLDKLGLRPRYILLTHGHFDHIGALPGLAAAFGAGSTGASGDRAGPAAPGDPGGCWSPEIAIHRADAPCLSAEGYGLQRAIFSFDGDREPDRFLTMPAPTRLLEEGDAAGPFRVLHLPGHSPGSVGFLLEKEKLLFSGDTLFRAGVGRTDFPGGDGAQLRQSLKRLFSLEGDIRVYPGHDDTTTIEREAKREPFF
jgi:glyoxylase-like metal-dependent hydrolase (beta-lactamase superfamily II)